MKAAADSGAEVIVAAGFLQEKALKQAAEDFPDVHFIFIDGAIEGYDNIASVNYKEEQAGYLAGYAAVMDGFTKLGFSGGGGGANPACIRYGYGYVQGVEAAAAEKDVDVEMRYSWEYGDTFSASPDLTAMLKGWYEAGTEVVFVSGGSMFQSGTEAAAANNGAIIGVDVDQSGQFDTVITSAMKALANSVNVALTDAMNNDWKFSEAYSAKQTVLGAAEDCVGLPMETSKFTNFTQEQYDALYTAIVDGTLVVDDSFDAEVHPATSNVTVDYQS